MRATAFLAMAFAACGGPPPPEDAVGDTGAPTAIDTSVETSPTAGAGLAGELVGPDGPLGNWDLLFCNLAGCLVGESEPDGRFLFPVASPASGAFKTHPELDRDPRMAALVLPATVPEEEEVDLETVYVPALPVGIPFDSPSADPQTLVAGDGLALTLSRGDLSPAPGTWLYDLAASRIPDDYVHSYPDLGAETVVGVYAIHPFGATSTSPIAVQAPSELPAGTEVLFRTISELDGTFSAAVSGRADGSVVATDPGVGIDRLTWMVITVP